MKTVYELLDTIKTHFRSNDITNTVEFGANFELDSDKTTLMPLVHFNLVDVTFSDNISTFQIDIKALDVVNKTKDVDTQDNFNKSTDLFDILNTQYLVLGDFVQKIKQGDLFDSKFRLSEDPTFSMERFVTPNELAGWSGSISIDVPTTIKIC